MYPDEEIMSDEEVIASWDDDKQQDGSIDTFRMEPPDGKYVAEILAATVARSQKDKPQVAIQLQIVEVIKITDKNYLAEPEGIIGTEFPRYISLSTEKARGFTRRQLYKCGMPATVKGRELPEALGKLEGGKVEFSVSTKEDKETGDMKANVFFNKRVEL